MQTLLQDLRYGLRMLRRSPGFTAAAILTLALGIGANTAIFSAVNGVLLRQLPFRDASRLTWVWCTRVDRAKAPFSIADFLDYREQNRGFEFLSAFAPWRPNLTGQGKPEQFTAIRISADVFQRLGVRARIGRALQPEDDAPQAQNVVVLTDAVWRTRFAADPAIIGAPLDLDGTSYTVVGVLPPNFFFPFRDAQFAAPLSPWSDPRRADRGNRFMDAIGRLKAGVTPTMAAADLVAIAQRLRTQYPSTNQKNIGVRVIPYAEELTANIRAGLWVLMGAVGLVLLIASSNLASLLLARAAGRQKEIAIRTALGASRQRLLLQLITENISLGAAGATLGFLLAWRSLPYLMRLSPPDIPRTGDISIDGWVVLFTVAISLVVSMLVAIVPALQATSIGSSGGLVGARVQGRMGGRVLHRALVVAQIGIGFVLLIGAGLLMKSLARLQAVNPGFDADHVLAIRLSLPKSGYSTHDRIEAFYERVRERLIAIPEIRSAGVVTIIPLSGPWATADFTIAGRPPKNESETPSAQYRLISPGYFTTMKVPLLSGRDFAESDRMSSRPVAIVSAALADRFWPKGGAVGSHIQVRFGSEKPPEAEIIGIVGNVKQLSLDAEATWDIYVPLRQAPASTLPYLAANMNWVARTATDPGAVATAFHRVVSDVDPEVATTSVRNMSEYLAGSVAVRNTNLALIEIFAVAALVLAAVGLYGVIAYSVTRRTREIGIRLALGAQPRNLRRLVFREGLALFGFGSALGLALAVPLVRLLSSQLFAVQPYDPIVAATVLAILLVTTMSASYFPARRATRIDPMIALRSE